MWKDWIRPWVRPLPQWSIVAVTPPQRMVTAVLRWNDTSTDVTTDHTVASLNPLVIATSVDAGQRPLLEYIDSDTGRVLGTLHLERKDAVVVDRASIVLYHVAGGEHRCLSRLRSAWNARLQNRSMLKNRASGHLNTDPAAVQQLMIAYLCPRPVVLVSVQTTEHRNIFPMDLIGPLERSGLFTLALRSNNVSASVIRETGRATLSHMPAAMKPAVYKLSEHHKLPLAAWDELPFPVRPSPAHGTPAVAAALRIQDLAIVHSLDIGLHTFFLCRVVSEESLADDVQLHHTAGFHQLYRRRSGRPFVEV
jgi:flavin reductase (DIM6/NTAB) family NADH-FMN oxidoreductase RutF